MFNVIIIFIMIYLILVLRVYSLTLYYVEFDKVRKYSWLAPYAFIRLFLYALSHEGKNVIKTCFVFHLPTTYVFMGLQYCLFQKEYVSRKSAMKGKAISFYPKSNKEKLNVKALFEKTEKFICQC